MLVEVNFQLFNRWRRRGLSKVVLDLTACLAEPSGAACNGKPLRLLILTGRISLGFNLPNETMEREVVQQKAVG